MIVSLVSQKGGVGKSTLALSIAWEWMSRGRKVLLVDADKQGTCRVAGDVAREKELPSPTVIAMGPGLYKPHELPRLSKGYDDVVVDTPAGAGEVQSAALKVAQVALIPVAPGLDAWSVTETIALVKTVQKTHPTLRGALVIARKVPRTTLAAGAREVLQQAGLPTLETETSNRIAWAEAPLSGKGLGQYAPGSAAAAELEDLVKELAAFTKGKRP